MSRVFFVFRLLNHPAAGNAGQESTADIDSKRCRKEYLFMSNTTANTASSRAFKVRPAMTKTQRRTRYLAVSAMLSAISIVLMQLDFSVPMMPSFLKMDLSDLPALIGSYSMGPLYGILIALVKNLLHLLRTSTGGVGELSNFLLCAVFVLPAGILYSRRKSKKSAIAGALAGAVSMALFSIAVNYFIVYPVYTAFMPMDTIIRMYQAILPSIPDGDLLRCLIVFNAPFTFVKAMLSVMITFLIYKPLSPLIHGTSMN